MPRNDVSSRKFATPMGVVKGAPIPLKLLNKLSHETAPPMSDIPQDDERKTIFLKCLLVESLSD